MSALSSMKATNEKEFVFDVIITKLELVNGTLPLQNVSVKFKWEDLDLSITPSRINVNDFKVDRSHGFNANVAELKSKLEEKPFSLVVYNKVEEKNVEGDDGQGVEEEGMVPQTNLRTSVTDYDAVVGEATCKWPAKLIETLNEDDFSPFPFVQNYDLKLDEKIVGIVTLSVLLHFKCEEDRRKWDSSKPYVEKDGKLGIYNEVEKCLDPDDIFFVIGNPPGPQILNANVFGGCGGKGPCPEKFEGSRYRLVRGTLVNDCGIIGPCGMADCCENKQADMNICDEILRGIKPDMPLGACCMDECEQIFGPMPDSCEGLTCTDLDLPCHAEFHTLDCDKKRKRKLNSRKWKRKCKCRFESSKKDQPKPKTEKLLQQIINSDPLTERRQQILYPHTCPPPQLTAPALPLQQRCCPICCEDISWVPIYGTCPKCGFKSKYLSPLEQMPYNENQTAQQIIEQWKEDAEKFRQQKKISKFGACTCTPLNECINCQLRRLRPESAKDEVSRRYLARASKDLEGEEEEGEEKEGEPSNHAYEIVEDTLSKPEDSRHRSNFEPSSYEIPKIAKVIEWCKKKSRVNGRFSISDSDLSFITSTNVEAGALDSNAKKHHDHAKINRKSADVHRRLSDRGYQRRRSKTIPKKVRTFDKSEYPGIVLGHKYCVGRHRKVPPKMGWLWNANVEKIRRGWRPGAIRLDTHKIMTYFLEDRADETEPVPICPKEDLLTSSDVDCDKENLHLKMPTLRVTKKHGEYNVTVHPVNDPNKPLDPLDMRSLPIQFNIERDPIILIRREIKTSLKQMGFKTCTCNMPIYDCECRSDSERDDLEEAMEDLCNRMRVPQLKNKLCLSDTSRSDSEIEFEFSPPAAIAKPMSPKARKICAETQYNADDMNGKDGNCLWFLEANKVRLPPGHPCGGPSRPPPCLPPRTNKNLPPGCPTDPLRPGGNKPDKPKRPPPKTQSKIKKITEKEVKSAGLTPSSPSKAEKFKKSNEMVQKPNFEKSTISKEPEKPVRASTATKPQSENSNGKPEEPAAKKDDKTVKPAAAPRSTQNKPDAKPGEKPKDAEDNRLKGGRTSNIQQSTINHAPPKPRAVDEPKRVRKPSVQKRLSKAPPAKPPPSKPKNWSGSKTVTVRRKEPCIEGRLSSVQFKSHQCDSAATWCPEPTPRKNGVSPCLKLSCPCY